MKNCISLVTAICFPFFVIGVNAEPLHPQLTDKHSFVLGAFRQSVTGDLHAERNGGGGEKIDFDNLDLDNTESSVMAEYRYRLKDRWLFAASVYQFNSSGKTTASREFEYDGVMFEAGARVNSNLEVDTYMIEALYSVYKSDRAEVSLGGGLHVFDFSTSIKAKVSVGDVEGSGGVGADDILAPLPNLRAQGFYAITPKWSIEGTVGWLSANYDDYDGEFTYLYARTVYRFTDHFGAGVGYQFVDVDLEHDGAHGTSGFDIEFSGPTAYLLYSF